MVKWLSSWLVEQVVWGSISGLATTISEIGYLLLPSHDMAERSLRQCKSSKQPTNQLYCLSVCPSFSIHCPSIILWYLKVLLLDFCQTWTASLLKSNAQFTYLPAWMGQGQN